MALQSQFLCSFFSGKVGDAHSVPLFPGPSQYTFRIRSQKASDSDEDPAPSSKKGFGSSNSNESAAAVSTSSSKKKQKKGRRERASIIRRTPLEKPAFVSQEDKAEAKEQSKNESAFILAWLGFGLVILVEGISLAASGFLPEEWDKLFVKYLYPSFTPTVFLFVAGAVAYGVFKYLQNENITQQK
ncbi:hypothetical protein HN51_010852 [Arachis hypogaea]|uniref:Protein LOW PSII ACCUMULATION 2 n=1 Tax=Arachis hypogaea TaxID=3818 RepID=A0A445E1K2_ARAHY|nr:protein LOW PSII ACCUMULATION 2, chloroplastic [Arachis hypogaea]QHO56019.1 Protein LOW PSII ACCUMULATION 2 [Arachis hypogaea]RYR69352.1 hypothetical protein Ahy_A03g015900 [Arachis hypogaea]